MRRYEKRLGGLLFGIALVAPALASCSLFSTEQKPAEEKASPLPSTPAQLQKGTDAAPAPLQPVASQPLAPSVEIFPGTGTFVGGAPPRAHAETAVDGQGGITLNFVAADIKDVAKAVLGDYLSLNYEIATNVQGTITIQTSRPLPKSQVLPVLEQALQLNGMVLVHSNGIYKVMPLADAKGTSGPLTTRDYRKAGYGVEIAPVRYIGAEEMQKLLVPLAPTQAVIHVDAARNILIIEGTEQDRQVLLDDIALFDADWLAGMSYGLFTPNYIDAQELTRELNQILGGLNSPIGGVVKLIPIERLNTVLVISPQEKYLEQLKGWVKRLDRPGEGSDKRVFVYQVQNGRAADLAGTLTKLMHGDHGTAPSSNGFGGQSDSSASGSNNGMTANLPPSSSQNDRADISALSLGSNGSVSVTADETNNAIVVLASPQEYSAIEAALRKLDAPPLQVYIQAAIAEVTLTNDLQFGVQYFYQHNTQSQFTLSDTKSATIAQSFPGFSYMFTPRANIQVILNALASITHIEVTSSPEIMVLNNQTASLQVGDRVPIATQQAVGVVTSTSAIVNSIQYQDTGVVLKVTPRVNHGGLVMMDISQEVSQVTNTTSSNIDSPTIQERKINTSVAIQDGQTIALGGLITDNRTKGKSGIPFAQQIPVIGYLFGDNTDNRTRTELMVLLTPHVVENTDQARAVTDELRKRLPEIQPVLDRVH
ncbi:MAG: type II secretion system secretin GspD [Rhizomicrobium sp.]